MADDEMKLLRQRSRGAKTQRLWDDPELQAILAEIDEDIRVGWKGTQSDEKERREEIYYLMRAVEEFKQRLQTRIANGKFAGKQLEDIERTKRGEPKSAS